MHPCVNARAKQIVATAGDRQLDVDPSYLLAGDERGLLRAFEESFVRVLARRVAGGEDDLDIGALLDNALA